MVANRNSCVWFCMWLVDLPNLSSLLDMLEWGKYVSLVKGTIHLVMDCVGKILGPFQTFLILKINSNFWFKLSPLISVGFVKYWPYRHTYNGQSFGHFLASYATAQNLKVSYFFANIACPWTIMISPSGGLDACTFLEKLSVLFLLFVWFMCSRCTLCGYPIVSNWGRSCWLFPLDAFGGFPFFRSPWLSSECSNINVCNPL